MAKLKKSQKSSPIKRTTKSGRQTTKKVAERDILWLKGLIEGAAGVGQRITSSPTGIVARHPRSLSLRIEDGIEYVTFPAFQGACTGYVKVLPKHEKIPKLSAYTMNFLVLIGQIELIVPQNNRPTEYKSGTVITIPKGVRYGLRNKSKEVCFLRFQTLNG